MSLGSRLNDRSLGNDLDRFWKLLRRRDSAKGRIRRRLLTLRVNRCAAKHGGYIGEGAEIEGIPHLPHGIHGVYISRYAHIGSECWIYQNVTIGEVGRKAPRIGDRCLIGAGACIVGGITVGNDVKIGAGAVVATDVPDGCTVVAQPPRIIQRG